MSASSEDYRLTTIVMVASVVITLLIVSAVSTNSVEIGGMPAMAWCAAIVFGIQWLASYLSPSKRAILHTLHSGSGVQPMGRLAIRRSRNGNC